MSRETAGQMSKQRVPGCGVSASAQGRAGPRHRPHQSVRWRLLALVAAALFALVGSASATSPEGGSVQLEPVISATLPILPRPGGSLYRGWDYLVARLVREGASEAELRQIYQDERMPFFGIVTFSVKPKESPAIYAPATSPARLALAREFLDQHRRTFAAAERELKVSRYVIAAILLVETHFGRNTGRELVINRLSRVASVGEPNNLLLNYQRLIRLDGSVTFQQVKDRARYLEKIFFPEILAVLELSRRYQLDPFALKGSIAGAFGLPQFLPTSFIRFGMDGNRNGVTSLFEPEDAIWSTGRFLSGSGWRDSGTAEEKRAVIWKYNRSEPYVDTILKIADLLSGAGSRPSIPPKTS